jgi:hypothetical protein
MVSYRPPHPAMRSDPQMQSVVKIEQFMITDARSSSSKVHPANISVPRESDVTQASCSEQRPLSGQRSQESNISGCHLLVAAEEEIRAPEFERYSPV